jgi:hypothetical protein
MLRKSAKCRRISLLLTYEEYVSIVQDKLCYYCDGVLPLYGAGLDRLDNNKDYQLDNVVPCCSDCNSIRGDRLTVKEMIAVAQLLKTMRSQEEKPAKPREKLATKRDVLKWNSSEASQVH